LKQNTILALCSLASVLGLVALSGCEGSSNGPKVYNQFDRLARPAVNEVFATVANNRHQTNDTDNPTDDQGQLANDIQTFMTHTAGRSQAITDQVKAVLVPDVLIADLTNTADQAEYLGVEIKHKFGGRKLSDDVVDTSLGVIFGNTIPSLGVADDGKEIAALTSDNVDAHTAPKHFQDGSQGFSAGVFPYLGPPQ
jgi:hypothetical protein